ncbi:MAG: PhnD/SsuA/transferrin family substrate-binding protein, partial [bacterium]
MKCLKSTFRFLKVGFFVVLIFIVAAPPAASANRNRGKSFTIAINLPPSLMNEGSATIIDYSNRLRKVLKRKTGWDFEWKIYGDWDSVVRAVQRKQADFAALPAYYFAKTMSESRPLLEPFVTFVSNESIASPFCLYTKKGNEFFTIDHLLNTRIAIGDEDDWVLLNKVFNDNGLPFPPADFFDGIEPMTPESAFSALVFNKVDAIFSDALSMAYVMEDNPNAGRIAIIECTSTLTNMLIVNRLGIDGEVLRKLEAVLVDMHRDP